MPAAIAYTLCPRFPEAHLFEVTCRVEQPDPAGQVFLLPVWIPGSYLIREFARHIVAIEAEAIGRDGKVKPLRLEKRDKASWQAAPCGGPLLLRYQVYAWDLSVRGAHLDTHHAFCNGSSVFLRPLRREDAPCRVTILPPPGAAYQDWRLATSLPRDGAPHWGFGAYRAEHYEDLIDHPLEMGRFVRLTFEVQGVPHHLVLTGQTEVNEARLKRDLTAICGWQMDLFGSPPLTDPYLFLVMAVGSGYGGLEHRNATALICERADLPAPGLADDARPEGYIRFLGLCSHEYFHRWHVKRIRPVAFMGQDWQRESYTRLLWLFEGFTSYYDDLCLVRAGVIAEADYLRLLEKTLTQVQKAPGRHAQSLAESSFDAWIKYYRPDENTPNAVVSYYAKGALLALCLDLALRDLDSAQTGDAPRSLDALMRRLWREYGVTGQGLDENAIFEQVAEQGGATLARWLKTAVESTAELPLARRLARFGVHLIWQADGTTPWLGIRLAAEGTEARLAYVRSGAPAEQAGLAAGDVLVALQGQRVTRQNLDALLASLPPEKPLECHYFRQDLLATTTITPTKPPAETAQLKLMSGNRAREKRQKNWLGTPVLGEAENKART
ncbi:MAG: PDZ domain-containing protein [Zoogloeaceae bacterium]|jgi:predicted metalloprotease with PDZ domain|nr:PDZ domain-containing protein [Zoogloeaceae bacterium]